MFYLLVENLHHVYLVLTTALFKRYPYRFTNIPSTYLRETSARPPRYHYITSNYLRDSMSDGRSFNDFHQMLFSPYTFIISTQIVKILTFFYQVIILFNDDFLLLHIIVKLGNKKASRLITQEVKTFAYCFIFKLMKRNSVHFFVTITHPFPLFLSL